MPTKRRPESSPHNVMKRARGVADDLGVDVLYATVPDGADKILQGALQHALSEEFRFDNIKVHTSANTVTQPASVWIKEQVKGTHTFAVQMTRQLAESSFRCVVERYPWRESEVMRNQIAARTDAVMASMVTGALDALVYGCNVDTILPPLTTVATLEECTEVLKELGLQDIRPVGSILQFYEAIYGVVCAGRATPLMHRIYQRLFR